MNVKQIIELLPDELIDDLAVSTKVDKYAKKLDGKTVFNLLIHCILSYKDNSFRRMENHFESLSFAYVNQDNKKVKYNSISERLSSMDVSFFRKLYLESLNRYSQLVPKNKSNLVRYDSTIVSLSSKLLKIGYNVKGTASKYNQVKYSIGYSELPVIAYFYTEQSFTSENLALKKVILEHDKENKDHIRVFDRGISSRKTYDELVKNKMPFVSRVNPNAKFEQVEKQTIKTKIIDELEFLEDSKAYLFTEKGKAKKIVRLIKTKQLKTDKEICFVTSIMDSTPEQIANLYKKRWEIETFFKFIKQELNFSHFINRSKNGIEIVLYCTLIAAILLLVYKNLNNLKGYKIMKQKFLQELEWTIMEDIIKMCGGDSKLLHNSTGKSPPN